MKGERKWVKGPDGEKQGRTQALGGSTRVFGISQWSQEEVEPKGLDWRTLSAVTFWGVEVAEERSMGRKEDICNTVINK